MLEVITYFIAGGSITALLIFWFAHAYTVLSGKKESVLLAAEQIELHLDGYEKVRGSPEEQTAKRMIETSIEIYAQIERIYHEALKTPLYRLPGYLMGFHEFSK